MAWHDYKRVLRLGKFVFKPLHSLYLTVYFEHVIEPLSTSNLSSVSLGLKYLGSCEVENGGLCIREVDVCTKLYHGRKHLAGVLKVKHTLQ